MRRVFPSVLATLCTLVACAAPQISESPPDAGITQQANTPADAGISEKHPLIVELVGKRHTIRITAGPDAPRYSIVSRSGTLVAAPMTLGEMATRNPQLYEQLRSTRVTPFVWAGLNQWDHDNPYNPFR